MKLSLRLAAMAGLFVAFGFAPLAQGAAQSCEGITEPVFDVKLGLPVSGIVAIENFKEGQLVKSNDVILELDSKLEASEVERFKAIMENAKNEFESTKKVFEKTASISLDEMRKKESEYKVAQADYDHAMEELRRRKLFAPGAGEIAELNLHVGETCNQYEPFVRLVDKSQCYFISNVEEKLASGLKKGDKIQVEIEDEKNPVKVEAKILFIQPIVDPASGLRKIKAIFDNSDGKVSPGVAGKMLID